jgi:GNAT superfamily N-acetyltransferase
MNDERDDSAPITCANTNVKRKLSAHVTHLEMSHAPTRVYPVPTRPVTALMAARNIPPEFYSFLYELVGKPCHWYDRRNMDSDELYNLINDPCCEIGVLYADGCPAGFYELDTEHLPGKVEIRYFGLAEDYQGMGLGKWFLATTIKAAWAHKPEKVSIETNTLDHPAALQLYQRMGFSPIAVSDVEIEPWD